MSLNPKIKIMPPRLTNNPSWDVIITQTTPLLSFFNADDQNKIKNYEIQIDKSNTFNSKSLITFDDVVYGNKFITGKKIDKKNELSDKTQYWWRARAISPKGQKSEWAVSRFFVDIESDKNFLNLSRAKIHKIEVSEGYNAKNIVDWDDPGLITFWQSPPPGEKQQWIKFDLKQPTEISRVWILSNPTDKDGWLKNFYFESSNDSKNWHRISKTTIKNNDTFRNIIDFKAIKARYVRLVINDFIGYAAQINEIILYTPAKPQSFKVPQTDYVLVVGNEHNGFTFTNLAKHIESLDLNLKTVTIPYFAISQKILENLPKKPLAIVLSGNNADYPNLPMFEHNGEFEIIRKSNIPILGICAGHQFLAMAYGYSRARNMGWSDISAIKPKTKMSHIRILKQDPIFKGVPNNFTAPEIHSWAVAEPAEEFEIIAQSDYIQAQKSKKRLIYGIQFHAEINVSYNQGSPIIENFLKLAKNSQASL
ncbi:MAG: discoidin domain-containing protein [Patescibacteria group bacterium]|nr:discoidin domain-containing protein [Patescibacteria group bacterium]